MARKARQRISYVLPLPNSPGGHRLGVNSLALDRRGILYSAGRDGSICSWDLHTDLNLRPTQQPADDDESNGKATGDNTRPTSPNEDDDDEMLLATPRTPRARPPASSFRSQVQAHTHWVNDIVLTAGADAVVSCSSDLTVKLWRPESRDNNAPATLGLHSDYVKCLATPGPDSGTVGDWVASGGLDRKIRLWDLKEGKGELMQIDVGDNGSNPKGSIYSLGVGGGILASGGPESVVRVWDPRSGKRITKFVGHTDLVRAILVSEQGNVILTASSDSTVKMWSVTGGRCMHTLTMHNDSVWSLCSSHPSLEVFHSSDRSGLVAKTDIRGVREIEDGICVALCQEQEGVSKVISDGGQDDYVWTATSSSRIHRWLDIDTNLEIGSAAAAAVKPTTASPVWRTHQHRVSNASYVSRVTMTNGKHKPSLSIPVASLLRLSTTSAFPSSQNVRDPDSVTVYSIGLPRQTSISEAIMNNEESGDPKPLREMADETIEGQNGLIKHVLLNDRRRVLTLDTAGEVVEWDLVKCSVVKAWGKKHLDEVTPQVNTLESVANWCQVDTRTGSLACVLEENYCFDAEMYADELELEDHIEFREDQRINLGKWVLRYIFSNLIDEEIKRDEDYRKFIAENKGSKDAMRRANAPPSISLPSSSMAWGSEPYSAGGPLSATTPRPNTGRYSGFPATTPGMTIGLATPASAYFPGNSPQEGNNSHMPELAEEDGNAARDDATTPTTDGHDYFSGSAVVATPTTPGGADGGDDHAAIPPVPPIPASVASSIPVPATTPTSATPTSPSTESTPAAGSKLGGLGKLWGQATKRASRVSGEDKDKKAAANATAAADKPAEEAAEVKPPEPLNDNMLNLIKRMRQGYDEAVAREQRNVAPTSVTPGSTAPPTAELVKSSICPSLPNETPVLKHPSNMVVMIQEDRPDSGGVADLYRGTIGELGRDADILENVAPAWLGEAILMNRIPPKEIVKVSFVLQPWNDNLPTLPSTTEGNSRLNANRMLRARKILAYIAERLDPLPEQAGGGTTGRPALKPEEWLEVLCKDELVPTNMTLGTMRAHVWKTGGDVMLYYRIKGGEAAIMPGDAQATTTGTTSAAATAATTAATTTMVNGTGSAGGSGTAGDGGSG